MRVRPWLRIILFALLWPALTAAQEPGITAFENVRVLTMTDAGVLERTERTVSRFATVLGFNTGHAEPRPGPQKPELAVKLPLERRVF